MTGGASVLMGRAEAHEPREGHKVAARARQVVSCQRPTTPTRRKCNLVDLVQTARDHMEVTG